MKPVDFIGYDVTGGEIEYQILEPMGPNTTHLMVLACFGPAVSSTGPACLPVSYRIHKGL